MVSEPPLDPRLRHRGRALRGRSRLAARRSSRRRDEAMDRGQAERLLPMLEEMLAEAGVGWARLGGIARLHRPRQLHRAARSPSPRPAGWRWRSASRRSACQRLRGARPTGRASDRGDARRQARTLRPELPRRRRGRAAIRRSAAPRPRGPRRRRHRPSRCRPRRRVARASRRGGSGARHRRRRSTCGRPTRCRRRSRRRPSSMTPEALAALHARGLHRHAPALDARRSSRPSSPSRHAPRQPSRAASPSAASPAPRPSS